MGWTASAKIENAVNLIDKKIITDRNIALEMLKISNTDPAYKYLMLHKTAADRENQDFKKGIQLEIGPQDDDVIHLDQHTPAVASYEFRASPQIVKDAYNMHIAQHMQRIEEAKQKQGMPGAPGESAGPAMTDGGMNPNQAGEAMVAPGHNMNMDQLLQK